MEKPEGRHGIDGAVSTSKALHFHDGRFAASGFRRRV